MIEPSLSQPPPQPLYVHTVYTYLRGVTPKEKKKMVVNEEIIAKNIRNLNAMINGDIDAVRIAGVIISMIDVEGYRFHFRVGDGLDVYGDELEITESMVCLNNNGITCAFMYLGDE